MTKYLFSPNLLSDFNDRKKETVGKMFSAYFPYVFEQISKKIKNHQDREDCTQDVFTDMFSSNATFDDIDSMELYLNKIIYSVCSDERRDVNTQRRILPEAARHYLQAEVRRKANARILEIYKSLTYVAVELLSPQCRQIFLMRYQDDFKNPRIARELGLAVKTVENHMNRAHQVLRLEVAKKEGDFRFLLILLIALVRTYFLLQNK